MKTILYLLQKASNEVKFFVNANNNFSSRGSLLMLDPIKFGWYRFAFRWTARAIIFSVRLIHIGAYDLLYFNLKPSITSNGTRK